MHTAKSARVDSLEPRRMLSVSFRGGVIRVVATDKQDVILVQNVDDARFRLNVNGEQRTFANSAVSLIDIRTLDSADRIDLTDIRIPARVDAGKGPDTVLGSERDDVLYGGGGSDRVFGNGGDDLLDGSLQSDTLDGGLGKDRLVPFSTPAYDDSIFGGEGADTVDYSAETKDLVIEIRNDGDAASQVVTDEIAGDVEEILGGAGDDVLINRLGSGLTIDGGGGNDSITGGTGNDLLIGGGGRDTLRGLAGNDTFRLGGRDGLADVVDGGDGDDVFFRTGTDDADVITSVG